MSAQWRPVLARTRVQRESMAVAELWFWGSAWHLRCCAEECRLVRAPQHPTGFGFVAVAALHVAAQAAQLPALPQPWRVGRECSRPRSCDSPLQESWGTGRKSADLQSPAEWRRSPRPGDPKRRALQAGEQACAGAAGGIAPGSRAEGAGAVSLPQSKRSGERPGGSAPHFFPASFSASIEALEISPRREGP